MTKKEYVKLRLLKDFIGENRTIKKGEVIDVETNGNIVYKPLVKDGIAEYVEKTKRSPCPDDQQLKKKLQEQKTKKLQNCKNLPTFDEMIENLPDKETAIQEKTNSENDEIPESSTLADIMQEKQCDRNTAWNMMKDREERKKNEQGWKEPKTQEPVKELDIEKKPITIPKQLLPYRFCFVDGKKPFPTGWQKLEKTYDAEDPRLKARLEKGDSYGIVGGFNDLMIVDCDNDTVFNAFSDHHDTLIGKTGNGKHLFYKRPGLQKSTALQELDRENSTPDKIEIKNCGHITSKGRMVVAAGSLHYNQIDGKYVPSGKRYTIINDVEVKTISQQELDKICKPFQPAIIRAKYELECNADMQANEVESKYKRDIDISLVAEKMDELEKVSPGYRGHNPSHPQSHSRKDLSINTTDNTWICAPCSQTGDGGGSGDALYLIALNEGILPCHECKKGGLRGENFVKVKQLAIEKYGIPEEMLPKEISKRISIKNGDRRIATLQIMGRDGFCINSNDGKIILPETKAKTPWQTSTHYRSIITKALVENCKIIDTEAEKAVNDMCAKANKKLKMLERKGAFSKGMDDEKKDVLDSIKKVSVALSKDGNIYNLHIDGEIIKLKDAELYDGPHPFCVQYLNRFLKKIVISQEDWDIKFIPYLLSDERIETEKERIDSQLDVVYQKFFQHIRNKSVHDWDDIEKRISYKNALYLDTKTGILLICGDLIQEFFERFRIPITFKTTTQDFNSFLRVEKELLLMERTQQRVGGNERKSFWRFDAEKLGISEKNITKEDPLDQDITGKDALKIEDFEQEDEDE